MEEYLSSGRMPFKLEESLNLQDAFSGLSGQIIMKMFDLLNDIPASEYPYAAYTKTSNHDSGIEMGIELVIEADIWSTDRISLRRNFSGFIVSITSEGDNYGHMEYELSFDDPLVKRIPKFVQDHMETELMKV